MHGRYPSRIKEADVDIIATNQWLKSSGLKAETEGLIIAAQDQTLPTKAYHHHIIKDDTDPQCCIYNNYQETVDHIVSGRPELEKNRIYTSAKQCDNLCTLQDLQRVQWAHSRQVIQT